MTIGILQNATRTRRRPENERKAVPPRRRSKFLPPAPSCLCFSSPRLTLNHPPPFFLPPFSPFPLTQPISSDVMPGPVASTSTLPASPVAAPKTTRSKGKGRSSLVAEEASTSANTPVADSTPRKPRMKKADVLLGKEARALKAAEIVEASASASAEVEEREERRPRMKKGDSRLPKRPASHFPKLKDLEEAEPEVEERDGIPRWGCSTLVSGGPPPATLPPVFSKDAS